MTLLEIDGVVAFAGALLLCAICLAVLLVAVLDDDCRGRKRRWEEFRRM